MPSSLRSIDPHIAHLIHTEDIRQHHEINFIASENYVSRAILEATGSCLTNKYAEGYPGRRYYAGCDVIDAIEQTALERCQKVFDAQFVNVQPHSGSSANLAAYCALLKPNDLILGMSLAHGGHLTHGHSVNISGTWFRSVSYGVDRDTELINYDEVEQLATTHRPQLIIAGASAYSRTIDFEQFSRIAASVNAFFMADIAHIAGLVAAGIHPSPLPYADIVTSTTHKTLRGPRGGLIMSNSTRLLPNGLSLGDAINRSIIPGTQGGPLMHSIAAKAVCFHEALLPEFLAYQRHIVTLAHYMATRFQQLGYRLIAGGTDNHLFIIDLQSTQHTGLSAEQILARHGITVSRSCIPYDTRKPWVASGIRIGTPAMATRGMTLDDADNAVMLIHNILQLSPPEFCADYHEAVNHLAERLPIPL